MKKLKRFYSIAVLCLLLAPSAGFVLQQLQGAKKPAEDLAKTAEHASEGLELLSEAGAYFEGHFGGRLLLAELNARLRRELLQVSAHDRVIVGTDGWLYYRDSLEDYMGLELLEDREIFNLAHSLHMIQEYARERGITFLFVPAPNKNTLYGAHMPYYTQLRTGKRSNLERLYEELEQEGVCYANLCEVFRGYDETLYHRTDSHWNNRGVAIAAREIQRQVGRDSQAWDEMEMRKENGFTGDLAAMLYPVNPETEPEFWFEQEFGYTYEWETASNFDPKIRTRNQAGEGSLVMYRDSFGNALLPFLAEEYAEAYFSRSEPFYFSDLDLYAADTLVIERAERFLPDLAQYAPVMQAPKRVSSENSLAKAASFWICGEEVQDEHQTGVRSLQCHQEGEWMMIEGILDADSPDENVCICLRIPDVGTFEAFPVTICTDGIRNPYGFRLFLPAELFLTEEGSAVLREAELLTGGVLRTQEEEGKG